MKKDNGKTENASENNFLLLSLDDENAKDVANVMGNDTSKRILNYLAKKDDTQTNIAKELDLPLPTVHYNLQQLQKAGLVVWENYKLSEKGKEIRYYKLANKYIIIAPRSEKKENILEKLRGVLPSFGLSLFGAFGIYTYYNMFASGGGSVMSFDDSIAQKSFVNGGVEVEAIGNEVVFDSAVNSINSSMPVSQNLVSNSSSFVTFLNEPYMWFLYGAIFALVFVIIFRLRSLKNKIKKK